MQLAVALLLCLAVVLGLLATIGVGHPRFALGWAALAALAGALAVPAVNAL